MNDVRYFLSVLRAGLRSVSAPYVRTVVIHLSNTCREHAHAFDQLN